MPLREQLLTFCLSVFFLLETLFKTKWKPDEPLF